MCDEAVGDERGGDGVCLMDTRMVCVCGMHRVYTRTHTSTHTHIYTHIYSHIHTPIHTHTYHRTRMVKLLEASVAADQQRHRQRMAAARKEKKAARKKTPTGTATTGGSGEDLRSGSSWSGKMRNKLGVWRTHSESEGAGGEEGGKEGGEGEEGGGGEAVQDAGQSGMCIGVCFYVFLVCFGARRDGITCVSQNSKHTYAPFPSSPIQHSPKKHTHAPKARPTHKCTHACPPSTHPHPHPTDGTVMQTIGKALSAPVKPFAQGLASLGSGVVAASAAAASAVSVVDRSVKTEGDEGYDDDSSSDDGHDDGMCFGGGGGGGGWGGGVYVFPCVTASVCMCVLCMYVCSVDIVYIIVTCTYIVLSYTHHTHTSQYPPHTHSTTSTPISCQHGSITISCCTQSKYIKKHQQRYKPQQR